jgi:2-keto-3-deoxy-L-rhamnonate aldolase RhmA
LIVDRAWSDRATVDRKKPMIDPAFLTRLREQPQVGCFVSFASPGFTEFIAQLGFDFTLLDSEHAAMDSTDIEDMIRASQCAGVPSIVRVPYNRPEYIRRALDSGANGVQVPLINNAEEARAAVRPALFPGAGERGVAYLTRAARYGMEPDRATYFDRCNATKVVSLHIETVEAVKNLDAILDVGCAEVYFVGPGDLAVSMGYAHDPNNAEVIRTIEHCIRTISKRGFVAGTLCTDLARTELAMEWGAHYLVTAIAPFLMQSVGTYLRAVRGQ